MDCMFSIFLVNLIKFFNLTVLYTFSFYLPYSKITVVMNPRRMDMSIEVRNEYGTVSISKEVITTIAGGAAVECYGIVGMASRKQLKDGLSEILGKENFSKGVVVRNEEDNIDIDMYIIVGYGTKVSEVAHNVQNQVKYSLKKMIGLDVNTVNIYIHGVRVTS